MKIVNTKKIIIDTNKNLDLLPLFEYLPDDCCTIRDFRNRINNTTKIKKKGFISIFLFKIKQKLLWK